MNYVFLGGAGEVGASCLLVKVAGRNILFDCGVRVNQTREKSLPNLELLRVHAPTLDAIFISHAHADHIGALPLVHKMYPTTPIYTTTPTAHAATVMLGNAVRLSLREALLEKENGLIFSENMVQKALNNILTTDHLEAWIDIGWGKNWAFKFIPAGHILGAVSIALRTQEGTYLYTGDVSAFNQRFVEGIGDKLTGINPDFMWCEATYGDSNHPTRKSEEQKIAKDVAAIIQDGGNVLIPAFALGRAQEIARILLTSIRSQVIPAFPIVTDGLVNKINKVYEENIKFSRMKTEHETRGKSPFFLILGISTTLPVQREHLMNLDMPKCVIASSGMLTGGASVDYAKAWAGIPQNAIFLSGYQDHESPGGHLQTLRQNNYLRFRDGMNVQVKCKIKRFHLSAHSDQRQLIRMIKQANPKAIALAHGGKKAIKTLTEKLSKDFLVTMPENNLIYETKQRHTSAHTYEYFQVVEASGND